MNLNNLKLKLLFKVLENTKYGSVSIQIASEEPRVFGEGDLVATVNFKSADNLLKIMSEGDIGLADGIIDNEIQISDETAFIRWACLNDEHLKQAFHGSFWGTLFHKFERYFQANTVKGAQENIMAHYDLGNDFYSKWLDSSMSYSSAIFNNLNLNNYYQNSENLTQAQYRKYDRIIESLNIKPGDRILEIGCGWGGFFSRAIQTKGCHVTAVMNSPAQCEYNKLLIQKNKMGDHIDLQLKDYRHIDGKFDKIVSIEMIEAVGEKYWPTYFEKIKNSLKPNGEAMIQSITIRDNRFEDYSNTTDFIKKYIFPGGMLLSNSVMSREAQKVGMKTDAPFEFGLSYAETLKRWKDSFNTSIKNGELSQLDQRFIRLWNLYFSYCEGAFLAGRINVAHFALK